MEITESMEAILHQLKNALDIHRNKPFSNKALEDYLKKQGIETTDVRLKNLKGLIERSNALLSLEPRSNNSFSETQINFIRKIIDKSLIIPDFNHFSSEIYDIAKLVQSNCNGKLASYIPELKNVDPNQFAVSICTIDGQILNFGDSEVDFCVQSTAKPINYAIALETQGETFVHKHIGREPSGKRFNEVTLNNQGLPHNPLINAGGMMCCALIEPDQSPSMRFDHIIQIWKKLTRRKDIIYDSAIYQSEKNTAHRNYALAHLMQEVGSFPKDTNMDEAVDLYIKTCSIKVNARNLANAAAVIANGGICPFTNRHIFSNTTIKDCLTVMSFCGMYDFSGEFAFKVGIPAKSGVSGAIMMIIPNLMGICVWSPNLDDFGNSVRGIEFANKLTERFNFHNFDSLIGNCPKINPRQPIRKDNLSTDLEH